MPETTPLWCYIALDPFDDRDSPQNSDEWVEMTGSMPAEDVPASCPTWLEIDMTVLNAEIDRWMDPDYGKAYWIVLTTVPPGETTGLASDDHYYRYIYHTADLSPSTGICLYYNHVTDAWVRRSPDMIVPYELVGITTLGRGYPIFAEGADIPTLRDAYEGMALIVTNSEGVMTAFRITDYDYQAPDEWVPNQTYTDPDRWEDHVGDLAHGAWVTPDKRRIFVTEDPTGIVNPGDTMEIIPSLLVVNRGANDTTVSSHGPGTVSLYYEDSVAIDEAALFSTDMDMRLHDMIEEVCVKAGVFDFECAMDGESSYEFTTGSGFQVWPKHRNAILKLDLPIMVNGDEVGALFRADDDVSPVEGYSVVLAGGSVPVLNFSSLSGSTWTLEESYPVPFSPGGEMTLSCQEALQASEDIIQTSFSVWIAGRFVHSFSTQGYTEGEYAGPFVTVSGSSIDLGYELSALDRRVDNFVFDMGSRGSQLISGVIGPKRVIVRDTATGGVWADRLKLVGPCDYELPALSVSVSETDNDTELRTLVRVEGIEVVESVDYDLLATDGFLFAMSNAPEANDEWETAQEADAVLADAKASLKTYSVMGPVDPRVEANDVIDVPLPDGTITMIVGSASISLVVDDADATFDMGLECFGASS